MPYIWLPYTQMQTAPAPLPVVGAEGCRIKLADGRELIDGIASWWSVCHGYQHPHMIETVQKQLQTLPHVMFAGINHEPALRLASRLAGIAPDGLDRVFFSDSGSTAIEVALKMAVQYWKNRGKNKKSKFICFHHGYHGDTMGAMSVSDPERMHAAYGGHVPLQYVMNIPSDEYGFSEFEQMVEGIHKQAAGIVIEPLVQCAGGFQFHGPDVLAEIRRIAEKYELLFIADEVATGFARTGFMFACDEAGITPDILCIGKALTGGTMTLAATLATEKVFEAFLDDQLEKALMHGPTYMANPLACAAAHASLDLFESEPRLQQVEQIEAWLTSALDRCRSLECVTDVRVKGAIGVIQYDTEQADMWRLRERFVEQGVWLRPFGDTLYLMPSYTISEEELNTLTNACYEALKECANAGS